MHLKSKKSGLIKNKTRIKVNENPFKQLFQIIIEKKSKPYANQGKERQSS